MLSGKDVVNLGSLALIQLANAIVPLAVFPYVLHVVGAERYADIVLTESVALISLVFVLYSFDVDGVRRLIGIKFLNDEKECAKIFYAIFWSRIILCLIVIVVVVSGLCVLYPKVVSLQLSWFLLVFGHVFQSAWFFQAIENNLYVGLATGVSRVISAVLVVIVVNKIESYLYVPVLIGGGYLISGIFAFAYANISFRMTMQFSGLSDICDLLKKGWHIFSGNISVVMLRGMNVIILKSMSSDSAVAVYSVAEKIIKCAQAAARPINQFSYPKVVIAIKKPCFNVIDSFEVIMKYTIPQLLFLCAFYFFVVASYYFVHSSGLIVSRIGDETILIMAVMAPATFVGICNFMFGTAGLNALGADKLYAMAIFVTGIVSLICSVVLIHNYGALGASMSFVIGEVLLLGNIFKILFRLSRGNACK